MGISDWLKSTFGKKETALSYYKSGIAKAEKRDNQGAVDDYTSAIEFPNANDKEKAMSLYNRALVYHSLRENEKAIDDLNLVLKMHGAHHEIKSAAKKKMERIRLRTGDTKRE